MDINWYPGHMTKTMRELKEKLKLIDIVVEVVDARAPGYTRNPEFDALFGSKQRMLVLNKRDLADGRAVDKWLSHFKEQGIYAVSYSAVTDSPKRLRAAIEECALPIYERYKERGMNKTVRAAVCGVPNVGKSAVLNRLCGYKKLKEGNMPGVTRSLQWVKITPYLELMDSPGLLWPKLGDERTAAAIALLGSVRQEVLNEEELCSYLLEMLVSSAPERLTERYGLEAPCGTGYELLLAICKKRGAIMRGCEPDTERGARMVLGDMKNGKMGKLTLEVPE